MADGSQKVPLERCRGELKRRSRCRVSGHAMPTHQSALVLIPPPEIWDPIQAIRRAHDRQFRRWMPHVTLLYPFLPRAELTGAIPSTEEALAQVKPFEIALRRFDVFGHRGGTFTVWLAPEPKDALVAVHSVLVQRFPECKATGHFDGGFTPHISVGQARDAERLRTFRLELEHWRPLTFAVSRVTIVVRKSPPDDVFRTFAETPIGASSAW